jgi:hypothetical protein
MFDFLLKMFLDGNIDEFKLSLAVQKGFITNAQKEEILNYGK